MQHFMTQKFNNTSMLLSVNGNSIGMLFVLTHKTKLNNVTKPYKILTASYSILEYTKLYKGEQVLNSN